MSASNYFAYYYNFITQTTIVKNQSKIKQIQILKAFVVIQAFHFLYLGLSGLSNYERILHFDGFYLSLVPKYTLNKMAFVATMMIFYYLDVLFLQPDTRLYSQLHDVLFNKSNLFFDCPYIKDKFIPDVVKQKFAIVWHLFQSILIITCKSNNNVFNLLKLHFCCCSVSYTLHLHYRKSGDCQTLEFNFEALLTFLLILSTTLALAHVHRILALLLHTWARFHAQFCHFRCPHRNVQPAHAPKLLLFSRT